MATTNIKNACILLLNAECKILCIRSKLRRTFREWNIPGGIIDPGETPWQAAEREFREETGNILPDITKEGINFEYYDIVNKSGTAITRIFIGLTYTPDLILNINDIKFNDETDMLGYYSYDEIINGHIKFINHALKSLIKLKNIIYNYYYRMNQTGGAFAFPNTGFFYIMAILNGTINTTINQLRTHLHLGVNMNNHMTLLQLHINRTSPTAVRCFSDKKLYTLIQNNFKDILKHVRLKPTDDKPYEILGITSNYLAAKYDSPYIYVYEAEFACFRRAILDYLVKTNNITNIKQEVRGTPGDQQKFAIYENALGEEIFGISEHYIGFCFWKPHISICNITELNRSDQANLTAANTNNTLTTYIPDILIPLDFSSEINKLRISFQDTRRNDLSGGNSRDYPV